ncbi:serine hydroxymethyltransferase [Patescibacteria group bacterium]|nr:serine hydroxymethyltransferase [Patescibacteria group bacterium]
MSYLQKNDRKIYNLIEQEKRRQLTTIRLIPSENYVSQAVLEAVGSVLTNKYSEGYAKRRYYQGQSIIDEIEELSKSRAERLFEMPHANVQPYSGSPANLACYLALLKPGDTIMGMTLTSGGHLTHGSSVSYTGKLFKVVPYTVSKETGRLDFDEIRAIAKKEKPKLIIAGFTAYPRKVSFSSFQKIAKEVGAFLHADISHIAGLVAAGVHPSPAGLADTVVATTHKTLRGPRGALILSKKMYAKSIDKAVFPGLQGGPHNNTTAAIGVALKEASRADFRKYAEQIIKNAKTLAEGLTKKGFTLATGGTDNHLVLADVSTRDITGKEAAIALEKAGIIVNYNTIPFDERPPMDPSGIRLGSPAVTTIGMKEAEMKLIVKWISEVLNNHNRESKLRKIGKEVAAFMKNYQYY